MLGDLAAALVEEARRVNERRLVVLAGAHHACLAAVPALLDGADLPRADCTYVGEAEPELETVSQARAGTLLGTTHAAVIFDAHGGLDPNALGRVIGTVDGGGLLVLLAPPLDDWPERRDAFDETLAVPPFGRSDVSGHFRRWFVDALRSHPGIAIVDVDEMRVERDGLTDPPSRGESAAPEPPEKHRFPTAAYRACLTRDQAAVLKAFEAMAEPGAAVVVEADRGRGKSSVAGLAAASFAVEGEDVLVTAPEFRSAAELFDRASALLQQIDPDATPGDRTLTTSSDGTIRYTPPADVQDGSADLLIVDEAAAIAVPLLSDYLTFDRVAFTTTIHGYEGAGRGFSVRFRDRLAESDLAVTAVTMTEPIRYAAGDPVEVWSFRALLLDAAPPTDELVLKARPETVEYRALPPDALLADEPLLREVFGLLVLAHYRTEPADLARLLDAPNVSVRALLHDGHVVSVALLAREGDLDADTRASMYEGARVQGNMLPDVLTSQLRDEAVGQLVGQRVMRIATHSAVRARGLGSMLLESIHAEFDDVDWFGAGYGATPRLVDFWRRNGYGTVHLSTSRNASSGEHSAIMLRPVTDEGVALHDRHATWFARRIGDVLSDALADIDPDIVRRVCRATDATLDLDLGADDWRLVAGAAYGPGLFDVDPGPFRTIARKHLVDPADPDLLTATQERLLVRKGLQAVPWGRAAADLGYPSHRQCMRALGAAYRPLVDTYGTEAAHAERDRFHPSEQA